MVLDRPAASLIAARGTPSMPAQSTRLIDYSSSNVILTEALLAKMLGVRRAIINEAASQPQQRKLINYCRGSITILDRKILEAASCRCYARMKELDTGGHGSTANQDKLRQAWAKLRSRALKKAG